MTKAASCKHGKVSRGPRKGRCRKRKLVTAKQRKLNKLDVMSAITSAQAFAPSAPKRSRYDSANTSKAFLNLNGTRKRRRR